MSIAQDMLIDAFGRIRELVHRNVQGLDEAALTARPQEKANSIAWLVWHLTRIQDDHMAELRDEEQIWTAGKWYDRFSLPFDAFDTGYGHTEDEVKQVQIDAKNLMAYHDAVYAVTVKFIKTLKDEDFDRVVDKNWDPPVTMAVRLISIVSDDLQHAGQAAYVRGLIQ